MTTLITGGCKNGKSFFAQNLAHWLSGGENLYYIATMVSKDGEDTERIARHKADREGYGFITIEQPQNIERCVELCGSRASVLLDSTTALLSNEMFSKNGTINPDVAEKVGEGILLLADKVKHIVVVSDWIFGDAEKYDPLTEEYRKSLAQIDCALAREFDTVYEIAFSRPIVHKGAVL